MSINSNYNPDAWASGDIITAGRMNTLQNQVKSITDEIVDARNYGSGSSGSLGARIDNMIIYSANQPSSPDNELWIQSESIEYSIPSNSEFEDLKDSIANEFDPNTSYVIGDYVWHNDTLHQFITNHNGDWSDNDVIDVVLADDVKNLDNKYIKYNTAQSLTDTQKLQSRENIGAANDADVAKLKSAIDPIALATLTWTNGKYLFVNPSHVVSEQNNEYYACTDYVLIPAGTSAKVHSYYSGYARTVLYNASKEWIADYQQTSGVTYGVIDIDIPAATTDRYVRTSCHVDKKTNAYVAIGESIAEIAGDITNLEKLSIIANGSRISASSQLASLDGAVPNTVYTFTTSVDENQPSPAGTLLTLNATRDNNGGHAQIYISFDGRVYTRIKWNRAGVTSFSAWDELTKKVQPFEYADATMFERIGVIGDSFASGIIYAEGATTESGKNYTHYEQSWPQCLGRNCGNTVINYSFGGATTKLWLSNSQYGKTKLESDDPCDLYMLCLGINDSNVNTGVSLGTEADIGTTADTFYRYYGDIVASIVAHAPNALIVFSTYCRKPTTAQSTTYAAYNNAIKALAEHYDVPCLVLTDDEYFNSDYWMEGMHNSHPTAAQYSGAAKAYNRLLAKSIVDNYSYYSNYNSTPTIISE